MRAHGDRVAGEALLHPALLASVALLLLNDHFLKSRAPGFLTGKLSDFAGLFFFPALLQAAWEVSCHALGRAWRRDERVLFAATALTMFVFSWVKLCPSGGELYRHGLAAVSRAPNILWALVRGSPAELGVVSLVQDPTDLVALPAAVAGAWVARRGSRHGVWSSTVAAFVIASFGYASTAHAQPDRGQQQPEDPSRPGQRREPIGVYARGGFGVGSGAATLANVVSVKSALSSGGGRVTTYYQGGGFAVDLVAALRIYRALIGFEYQLGRVGNGSDSFETRALGIGPPTEATFHLIGPMGGVQVGRDPIWVFGGSLGWAKFSDNGFSGAEGTRIDSNAEDGNGLGLSGWGGPAFRIGGGLLLGVHVRLTAVADSIAFVMDDESESAFQGALLAHISYQTN